MRKDKAVIDGLSTFIIAAFTMVLAWSTLRLWRETERLARGADAQGEKMERGIQQTRRMALATMISARAAKKSAAVAEKALYTLEGSHIEIARLEYDTEISVRVKNYGRTAAELGHLHIKAWVQSWPMTNPRNIYGLEEPIEISGAGMIAAGQDEVFSTQFFADRAKDHRPNILNGTYALRVQIKLKSRGELEDKREGMQWFVWDFRSRKFVKGFTLLAFDPDKRK